MDKSLVNYSHVENERTKLTHTSDLPIGVFDSGIGGLTVASALNQLLPSEDIIYLGDTARVPYGTKSDKTIKRYAMECTLFLLNKGVKLILVACNTASAVAIDSLRSTLRVPLVGVVDPGVKAALRYPGRRIGVIGTPSTIRSNAYQSRLTVLDPKSIVFGKACPLLVPLAEEGRLKGPVVDMILKSYLKNLKQKSIDTLILGCTHYPLLKSSIRKFMGDDVRLVDSAESASFEVEETLLREGLLRTHGPGVVHCYITDMPRSFSGLSRLFFGKSLGRASSANLGENV